MAIRCKNYLIIFRQLPISRLLLLEKIFQNLGMTVMDGEHILALILETLTIFLQKIMSATILLIRSQQDSIL